MTENARLSARKLRAVRLLAEGKRVGTVASSLGVNPTTLLRWRSLPAFVGALADARNSAFAETIANLRLASGEATTVCRRVMKTNASSASEKLSAAKVVLTIALKAHETLDLEQRLSALEARVRGVAP